MLRAAPTDGFGNFPLEFKSVLIEESFWSEVAVDTNQSHSFAMSLSAVP